MGLSTLPRPSPCLFLLSTTMDGVSRNNWRHVSESLETHTFFTTISADGQLTAYLNRQASWSLAELMPRKYYILGPYLLLSSTSASASSFLSFFFNIDRVFSERIIAKCSPCLACLRNFQGPCGLAWAQTDPPIGFRLTHLAQSTTRIRSYGLDFDLLAVLVMRTDVC
jgi:hypothetical protein